MRVHFQHEEKTTGLLRSDRQIEVIAYVEFSDEERLIVERRGLQNFVLLERVPDARLANRFTPDEFEAWEQSFHLRIRDLLVATPNRFTLDTPSDAKAYQARLTEALRNLKSFILANASLSEPTTLEI